MTIISAHRTKKAALETAQITQDSTGVPTKVEKRGTWWFVIAG